MRASNLLLLPLVVAAASARARAQVTELWTRTYDGPQSQADYGNKVVVDASGNVIVTGHSYNASVGFPPPPPTDDAITLKYDAAGNLLWARRFDGYGGDDNMRGLAVDPANGAVYAAGFSDGYVASAWVYDIRLIKYDAAGNEQWARAYDGTGAGYDTTRTVAVDGSGNVFVAGTSYDATNKNDMIVLKYDAAGTLVWPARVDGIAHLDDGGAAMAFDTLGDVFICGQAYTAASAASLAVAKVSPAGAVLWERELAGAGGGIAYALGVVCDATGAVYVCGYANGVGTAADATIAKWDGNGVFQWTRSIDGTAHGSDQLAEIALDFEGRIVVGGYTTSTGTGLDFLAARYDAAGNQLWSRTWDSPAHFDDRAVAVCVDGAGVVSLGGTAYGASGQPTDVDVACARWDKNGTFRGTHLTTTAGIGDDRAADLALGANGALVLTGSTTAGAQATADVYTIVLREQAASFCYGDGSTLACPCGNQSAVGAGKGCLNSIGDGAKLQDGGLASLAADTLTITSSGELPSVLSIFLQGNATTAAPFGDGVRCVAGILKRLYVKNASGGTVTAPLAGDPTMSARSAILGDPLVMGDVRYYQVYYRDPEPTFCPIPTGNNWNVSNGLIVTWAP